MFSLPLIPSISPPHHFLPQCLIETLVGVFCNLDSVRCLSDGQARSLFACLRSPVYRYQKVMASAFHAHSYFAVVADDDGSYVQAVRCNGCERNRARLRYDDRSTDRQRVGGGACRCADDQPVCHVSGQKFAVDGGSYTNHRCIVTFQQRYVIEGEG